MGLDRREGEKQVGGGKMEESGIYGVSSMKLGVKCRVGRCGKKDA